MFRFEAVSTPLAPGEVLKEKLVDGMNLTQAELARALGISCPRLNMILKGRCQITAEIALRIERVFDISPQYWLRIRTEFELFEERERISRELESLSQLTAVNRREELVWRSTQWRAAA
jgi:addiction module HigA family antidote